MLKIAEKILNGENPTLCFFGDSVTHGEFEFTNGYKESVQKPELVYHKLLADRIRETYGKDFTGARGSLNYQPVQTPLQFERIGNGGLRNRCLQFIHYLPEQRVESINF